MHVKIIQKGSFIEETNGDYKYLVTQESEFKFNDFKLNSKIKNKYFILYEDGLLRIFPGYRWDGASGPFIKDTDDFMLGSLAHDCLYQCIRENCKTKEEHSEFRLKADGILKEICKLEGMNLIKRNLVYIGVRLFGWLFT